MADSAADRDGEDVVVLVCMECGREYSYTEAPPDSLKCGKCGNEVFRSFEERGGEAVEDFRDSTERDVGTADGPSEVVPDDLRDLQEL
jgi:DNA-directed RNA polymerase subunit RPC12/RpoP